MPSPSPAADIRFVGQTTSALSDVRVASVYSSAAVKETLGGFVWARSESSSLVRILPACCSCACRIFAYRVFVCCLPACCLFACRVFVCCLPACCLFACHLPACACVDAACLRAGSTNRGFSSARERYRFSFCLHRVAAALTCSMVRYWERSSYSPSNS